MRARKIKHRKNICLNVMGEDWYNVDGKYAKGKIHCSCPMCTFSKYYHLSSYKSEMEDERMKDMLNETNI